MKVYIVSRHNLITDEAKIIAVFRSWQKADAFIKKQPVSWDYEYLRKPFKLSD